jgi:glycosyltransferase involved in cell wall biosynthesis
MTAQATKVAILHYQAYPDIRVSKFARTLAAAGFDVTVLARDIVTGDDPRGKHPYAGQAAAAADNVELRAVTPPGARGLRRSLYMPYHVNPFWRSAITRLLDDGCRLIVVRDLHLVLAATSLAHPRGVPVLFDMAENYPAVLATWRQYEGRRRAVTNSVIRNIALARRVERAAVRAADAVTVVVPEHVARVRSLAPDRDVEVVVVENTPVLDELTPDADWPARDPNDAVLDIVYTGEIHVYRGIDTVIAAARLLASRGGPRVRFTLVGTGKLQAELQRQAAAAGVSEAVQFLGWQPDLRPFLARADAGIVPPHGSAHYDVTMPNKLYDLMAFGKPVLVSDTAPMRRVVSDADCGIVFRSGDAEALASAVERLRDPELRRRLGANGRAAVETRYRWDHDGAMLTDLARRLLDNQAGSGQAPNIRTTRMGSGR